MGPGMVGSNLYKVRKVQPKGSKAKQIDLLQTKTLQLIINIQTTQDLIFSSAKMEMCINKFHDHDSW